MSAIAKTFRCIGFACIVIGIWMALTSISPYIWMAIELIRDWATLGLHLYLHGPIIIILGFSIFQLGQWISPY